MFRLSWQATDALEMMLMSVLSPAVRCEWKLQDWEVAMISMVSIVPFYYNTIFSVLFQRIVCDMMYDTLGDLDSFSIHRYRLVIVPSSTLRTQRC